MGIDVNGDGKIDAKEYYRFLKRVGVSLSKDEDAAFNDQFAAVCKELGDDCTKGLTLTSWTKFATVRLQQQLLRTPKPDEYLHMVLRVARERLKPSTEPVTYVTEAAMSE